MLGTITHRQLLAPSASLNSGHNEEQESAVPRFPSMRNWPVISSFILGAMLYAVPAAAQPKPDQPPATTVDPKACAPGERLAQGQTKPDTKVAPGETLSDKLARTEGVLCPPRVDPDIAEKPPAGGAMKVIPPPGTPGNQPEVRPK